LRALIAVCRVATGADGWPAPLCRNANSLIKKARTLGRRLRILLTVGGCNGAYSPSHRAGI
jgi:hypothetical protein